MEQSETGAAHTIWLGDFNHHHPHWDDPNNTKLFTTPALKEAEVLIKAVAALGLDLALPRGMPMHCHNVTKKWSRLNQVFISEHSTDLIELCETETRFQSLKTDHLPVVIKLNLEIAATQPSTIWNYRQVAWEEF